MRTIFHWLRRAGEAVTALFMFLIFATFIIQVAIRYGARLDWLVAAVPVLDPAHFGWTLEFCLALWVWLIFWGNAFIVRRQDHVTFDILVESVPRPAARVFMAVSGLAIAIGFLASIEPTWSRFAILRLKQTATLGDLFGGWIRMRDVYVIYFVFLAIVGLRALWATVEAVLGRQILSSEPERDSDENDGAVR